jgi:DNA-binding phage protein
MSYDARMSTKDRLAQLAASVSALDLAREAGISTKSVYRLRQKKANPTLEMIEAVERAVAVIKARAPQRQAA